jgi:hypothetical protein
MDTQLVTTDDAQRLAQAFGKSIEVAADELDEFYQMLRAMPLSQAKAELAIEIAQKCKRYIEQIDNSEPREIATNLDKAHKIFVKAINRWRKRGEIPLKLCNDTRSEWEVERQRRNEATRRQKEEQQNLFAAEQRKAELEHLRKIGKAQEAQVLATTPIRPVTVPFDPDAGKPLGEVMVEVWVAKKDEFDEIVFTDLTAFLKWVAENPPMHHLVKPQYAKLKKLLTDNRGLLQPPGLVIEHKFEPRTRMEADD